MHTSEGNLRSHGRPRPHKCREAFNLVLAIGRVVDLGRGIQLRSFRTEGTDPPLDQRVCPGRLPDVERVSKQRPIPPLWFNRCLVSVQGHEAARGGCKALRLRPPS